MNNDKTGNGSTEKSYGVPALSGGRASLVMPGIRRWVARAALLLLVLLTFQAFAETEETFATLKVGDHVYQNVKVTTKGKNFIIIAHSGGITSVKTSELPLQILQKLGYAPRPTPKKHVKEGPMLASLSIPKVDALWMQPIKAKLTQVWEKANVASKVRLVRTDRRWIAIAAGIGLLLYLFYSYCCLLICQKTGYYPGVWVWLPIIQFFPMLQAASMSPWWFIASVIPGPNLLAYVVWCLRIVQARQKTTPLTVLLLFPLTSWLAFVFLAFSDGNATGDKEQVEGLSQLQTVGA